MLKSDANYFVKDKSHVRLQKGALFQLFLSKRRKEMICPEQFTPPAIGFAARVETFSAIHTAKKFAKKEKCF